MPPLEPYHKSLPYSYAAGLFPCMEALNKRPDLVRRVLLSSQVEQGETLHALQTLCGTLGIRMEVADRALRRILGKENTYAAAVFDKQDTVLSTTGRQLVLHQPGDRGNLGTMLRTALGFGFHDIAIIGPSADPYDPHVIRASMGALFSLRIRLFDNFDTYRATHGLHYLYPFMLDASLPIEEAVQHIKTPYALIMGNEGSGLPGSFAKLGQPVRIPHSNAIDSLNLAVAAAIGMYDFVTAEGS